jgi:hypothetical protein
VRVPGVGLQDVPFFPRVYEADQTLVRLLNSHEKIILFGQGRHSGESVGVRFQSFFAIGAFDARQLEIIQEALGNLQVSTEKHLAGIMQFLLCKDYCHNSLLANQEKIVKHIYI